MKLRADEGLTLVEVMVALAVAAVVLVMVQGVFFNASTLREASRVESVVYHRSRVFFDRLARELGSALYRQGHPYARFALRDGREPELEFSSFAASPGLDGRIGSAALIRYSLRRDDVAEGFELLRSERPLQQETGTDDAQRLVQGLQSIELRCFDGERWQTSWDAGQQGRLPLLLEVSFKVRGEEEQTTPFRSVMEISSGSGG